MTAGHSDRRLVKIRRRGRHSTPSQVEKVAAQAGRAAPAVAIAGALVAVPSAQHAFAAQDRPATVTTQAHEAAHAAQKGAETAAELDSISTRAVTVSSATTAKHSAQVKSSHYKVRSGNTLSTIAQHFYDKATDWGYIYHENDKKISDPNLIYVGETLFIPGKVPADYKLADYMPKHAAPVAAPTAPTATVTASTTSNSNSGNSGTVVVQSTTGNSTGAGTGPSGGTGTSGGLSGTLGCSGLEQLWDAAGGNQADAFMAAEIAMAESGGNQYALSPTDDYGYWQINASNGALATFNAYGNARSAIILSDDGTNWDAWTTYTEGRYVGKC
jgi:LysM repeat protein